MITQGILAYYFFSINLTGLGVTMVVLSTINFFVTTIKLIVDLNK